MRENAMERFIGLDARESSCTSKAKRRQFSATYELRIEEGAERCKGNEGAIGELLRREGLYPSHLTTCRQQREAGALRELDAAGGERRRLVATPPPASARGGGRQVAWPRQGRHR